MGEDRAPRRMNLRLDGILVPLQLIFDLIFFGLRKLAVARLGLRFRYRFAA